MFRGHTVSFFTGSHVSAGLLSRSESAISLVCHKLRKHSDIRRPSTAENADATTACDLNIQAFEKELHIATSLRQAPVISPSSPFAVPLPSYGGVHSAVPFSLMQPQQHNQHPYLHQPPPQQPPHGPSPSHHPMCAPAPPPPCPPLPTFLTTLPDDFVQDGEVSGVHHPSLEVVPLWRAFASAHLLRALCCCCRTCCALHTTAPAAAALAGHGMGRAQPGKRGRDRRGRGTTLHPPCRIGAHRLRPPPPPALRARLQWAEGLVQLELGQGAAQAGPSPDAGPRSSDCGARAGWHGSAATAGLEAALERKGSEGGDSEALAALDLAAGACCSSASGGGTSCSSSASGESSRGIQGRGRRRSGSNAWGRLRGSSQEGAGAAGQQLGLDQHDQDSCSRDDREGTHCGAGAAHKGGSTLHANHTGAGRDGSSSGPRCARRRVRQQLTGFQQQFTHVAKLQVDVQQAALGA